MPGKLDYHKLVDYDTADPAKVLAQSQGALTSKNMPDGFSEVGGTRGESAYVFDMGSSYGALVQEGLGTKSLITQAVYENSGKSYFKEIAQDTVATIINDLISVGAEPVALNAYWSSSSYNWLLDKNLTEDFIKGWKSACDLAEVTWGGGETQALEGVVNEGRLELAGCAFGVIKNKTNLVNENKLQSGDKIVLIESNGVHTNGISLTRKIAERLKDGYETKINNDTTYGEALLRPSHIYTSLLKEIRSNNLDLHYLSHITGHGWRKLMRANKEFTYEIEDIPEVDDIFKFIQEKSENSLEDMYGNYNMGAGYALFLPESDATKATEIARELNLKALIAGEVKTGPRKVAIKPLGITFDSRSLKLR